MRASARIFFYAFFTTRPGRAYVVPPIDSPSPPLCQVFIHFYFAFFACHFAVKFVKQKKKNGADFFFVTSCTKVRNLSPMKLHLLSVGSDAKTSKGEKFGWLTAILYLAPARQAGRGEVCTHRSKGCTLACLYTAGRGKMSSVQKARIKRTQLFFDNFAAFQTLLFADIASFVAACEKQGMKACVRLNGTSDIAWERLGVFAAFPSVQFYDYSKSPIRALQFAKGSMPSNYHLTFSRSEENEVQALDILRAGGNVAVVFGGVFPKLWNGFPVIDGDESDLRFLDKRNVVVGLKAKGDGKKDSTGFVVYA